MDAKRKNGRWPPERGRGSKLTRMGGGRVGGGRGGEGGIGAVKKKATFHRLTIGKAGTEGNGKNGKMEKW